jgi:outer membrane receptor protein involved in Fe transport
VCAPRLRGWVFVNYEVRVKASLLDRRIALEATFFRMNEDGVVLSIRQGPFFFPTNSGELDYRGVETGVTYAFHPKVTAYLNASFYQNRFGDFVIETEDGDEDLTGNRLVMSPDHVVN